MGTNEAFVGSDFVDSAGLEMQPRVKSLRSDTIPCRMTGVTLHTGLYPQRGGTGEAFVGLDFVDAAGIMFDTYKTVKARFQPWHSGNSP